MMNDEGRQPPAEVIAAMNAQYNLDSPARFYVDYLASASGARWVIESLKGPAGNPPPHVFDFGPSFRYEDWSVNELVASTLPVSIVLGLAAIVIALVIGVVAGVVGAVRPNSFADLATLIVALAGISLPSFVIGTALLMIFPVWLGWGTVGSWGRVQDMLLPALTLSLPFAAYIARLTRMGMIEALGADYIRTARAKGLPARDIIFRHALKNAFLPVLSYLGPACAFAMTGSFVVERVFNVPGIGQHFVSAVKNKDLFVIMGVTLIYSALLVFFNLIVDVLYRWVDPRISA
jgi:oligopeptide transport system permease protein